MNIRQSFQKWRAIRRTENELNAMTARELDDLGISRADIPNIARRSVR